MNDNTPPGRAIPGSAGSQPPLSGPPPSRSEAARRQAEDGKRLLAEGRTEEALTCFAGSIKLQARNPEAYAGAGMALSQMGRVMEAQACFRELVQIAPADPAARVALGRSLRRLGRAQDAETQFRRALEAQPGYAPAVAALDALSRDAPDPGEPLVIARPAPQRTPVDPDSGPPEPRPDIRPFLRPAPITRALVAANAIVFVAMTIAGGSTRDKVLLAFGAQDNSLILQGHQWWRLLAPMFLHIGLLHLAFNCWALWYFGPLVENAYGRTRFLLLYVLAGLAGNLLTLGDPNVLSAGASGAIFGVIGAALAFGIRYKRQVPPQLAGVFGRGVVPIILFNLVWGLRNPQINMWAHSGGLLAGAALGWLLRPGAQEPDGEAPVGPALRLAHAAAVVALLATALFMFQSVALARLPFYQGGVPNL